MTFGVDIDFVVESMGECRFIQAFLPVKVFVDHSAHGDAAGQAVIALPVMFGLGELTTIVVRVIYHLHGSGALVR